MSKAHLYSSGPLDDPDSEEYEYMNKQASVTSLPTRRNSTIKDGFQRPKITKRQSSSILPQDAASTGDVTSSGEDSGGHCGNKNKGTNHSSDSEDQVSRGVEHEYMDLRSFETENGPPTREPPHLKTTNHEDLRVRGKVEDEENEDKYVEDDNYQYTNRQPNLRQALQDGKGLKTQGMDEEQAYEYEEMDSLAAPAAGGSAEYENLQGEGEGAVGSTETHRPGFGTCVKVRAGVGVVEPGGTDRSFDNPDYWHSRMFLKPSAVST